MINRAYAVSCACFLLGCCMGLPFAKSRHSETLLASAATLTSEWKELRPKAPLQTTGDWSEIFIEFPRGSDRSERSTFDDKTVENSIEGYLTTESGERVPLSEAEPISISAKKLLRLSAPALEWTKQKYRFRSVCLRSKRLIRVGRVVWISYDPSSTHSGFLVPDLLR
jgi:hypothetical protein